MKIIGITGGIGTGKSTLLHRIERLEGVSVLESDKVGHLLMRAGNHVYDEVVSAFGTDILTQDGEIDRERLGKIVFGDAVRLEQLNRIVHPNVKAYILRDIEEKRKQGMAYYFIEGALLIEDHYDAVCDELWYVYADKEVRLARLQAGRGGTRKKYESIMDSQEQDAFYRTHCDVVLNNGNDIENTLNIVKGLLNKES